VSKDRKFGSLLKRALKGEALDLTRDDIRLFAELESLRSDLANGIELSG
jgi:hypothetical protein